jgi:uncharacterized membrane protein
MPKKESIIKEIVAPLTEVEFNHKDALQVIIGASILAIPVGFTEEVWKLGQDLPLINALGFLALSIFFIAFFTYYTYHRRHHKENIPGHWPVFVKRVLATYIFAFIIVSIILVLIQKSYLSAEFLVALKRSIIVTFPASLSGAIADTIK